LEAQIGGVNAFSGLSGPKNISLKERFPKVQGDGHGRFRADRAGRRAGFEGCGIAGEGSDLWFL